MSPRSARHTVLSEIAAFDKDDEDLRVVIETPVENRMRSHLAPKEKLPIREQLISRCSNLLCALLNCVFDITSYIVRRPFGFVDFAFCL